MKLGCVEKLECWLLPPFLPPCLRSGPSEGQIFHPARDIFLCVMVIDGLCIFRNLADK